MTELYFPSMTDPVSQKPCPSTTSSFLLQHHSSPHSPIDFPNLPARAPDVLEETILLCESVYAVVRLAHGADETAKGVGRVLAGVSAVLVDLCDGDLDRSVVLGLDDTVGCAALAWDVPRKVAALVI